MTTNIQAVDLIFKTHLDLGFTDLARDVERQYFEDYIPGAINTAENLRRSGGSKRFIWTTGAWLIFAYLERAPSSQRRRLESAIDAGDIVWHALPFTMHSEFADESLFRHGLTYAKQLDARFGRKTICTITFGVPTFRCGMKMLRALDSCSVSAVLRD